MKKKQLDNFFYEKPKLDSESVFGRIYKKHPETMCLYPFGHINMKSTGALAPCFRSKATGNLNRESVEESWNNESLKEIRKKLTEGTFPDECLSCKKLEDSGCYSYRMESLRDVKRKTIWRDNLDSYNLETGELNELPKEIEIRFSNICNLKCRICGPEYSSKWEQDWKKGTSLTTWMHKNNIRYDRPLEQMAKSDINVFRKKILSYLEKNGHHIRNLMITGGEPLLDKTHFEALDILKKYGENITVDYITNLNVLGFENYTVLDYWNLFRKVLVRISIDGDPEIYPLVRTGGDILSVENNIREIYERFPRNSNSRMESQLVIFATMTINLYNVSRIIETAKYFTQLGCFFHSSFVNYPEILSPLVLPEEEKKILTEKVEIFLDDLDNNMANSWNNLEVWQSEVDREEQLKRIYRSLKNTLNFINGGNKSHLFTKFSDFEKYSKKDSGLSIFDFYPHWLKYV